MMAPILAIVRAWDDLHCTVRFVHLVERQPNGAGCPRSDWPILAILMPWYFASGLWQFTEQMRQPQDNIGPDNSFDHFQDSRVARNFVERRMPFHAVGPSAIEMRIDHPVGHDLRIA